VGNAVQKVLFIQAISAVVLAILAYALGGTLAVVSVLTGAGLVVVANLGYIWLVRPSRTQSMSGSAVLARHVIAELVKLFLLFSLMGAAFASGVFAVGWLVGAVGVASFAPWLSMLSRSKS
jgi:F0F1-type ATP synthase assembly protein I